MAGSVTASEEAGKVAAPTGNTRVSAVRSVLTASSVLWVILVLTELILFLSIGTSPLRSADFSILEKAAIFGRDMWSAAIFTLILGGPLISLHVCVIRNVARRKITSRTAHALLACVAVAMVFLLVASWACFWQLGLFLDHEVLEFAKAQSLQILHWTPTNVQLVTPLSIAVLTVAIYWVLPRAVKWIRAKRKELAFNLGVIAAIGLAVGLEFLGRPNHNRNLDLLRRGTRVYQQMPAIGALTLGQRYSQTMAYQSGAFGRGIMDILAQVSPAKEQFPMPADGLFEYRPIIPMRQYVETATKREYHHFNVVVITIESLGLSPLRAFGSTQDVMPNLDRFAAESTVFRRAYANSTHTNYASPCVLSSQYPLRSDEMYIYDQHLTYPRVMLYDILKALGYRTGFFSSGNELWFGTAYFWDTGGLDRFVHAGKWDGPTFVPAGDTAFASWAAKTRNAGSIDDRYTIDEAIKWIDASGTQAEGNDPAKPFMLYVGPQNSHFPYTTPADYPRKFSSGKIDFPFSFGNFPKEKISEVRGMYYDSLNYVDSQVGRLLDHLKAKGLWDNTVIVVTGDHGQAFYEHGFATHANALFDECLHVPIIFHAPGHPASSDNRPMQHVDIPPTLLGLLGLPPHPSAQGKDVFDPKTLENRPLFAVARTPEANQVSMIRNSRKIIYDGRWDAFSLFDLASDPAESTDLLNPADPISSAMADELMSWRNSQIAYFHSPDRQRLTYPPISK